MQDEDTDPDAEEGVTDAAARHRQADLLRELARRLDAGERALPTDVFGQVVRQLELRLDDDAIAEAQAEQGARKAEPWVFCRGRVQG